MMRKKIQWNEIWGVVALLILVALGFVAQRAVPFMTDDELYATNLATGELLSGLADVVESQVWHFFNWGGRCVTHGILQLTLMSGELCADVFNLLMTLLLTLMVCVIIGRKNLSAFLLIHAMIYAMNANLKMSMLWQSGIANYVYSSVWILLFVLPYLRLLREPDAKPLPFVAFWLIPIGLMAGWSNENMGPACFLLAAGSTLYLKKKRKRPVQGWMISGILFSLLGSVLVVAAPGNFVRSATVEKPNLFERVYTMLTAGVDFLLPVVVPMVLLLLINSVCLKRKMDGAQWALLITAVLSYGAMVLSPHYPDRATFGTMILCIALSVSLLFEIVRENVRFARCTTALTACYFFCAVGKLAAEILHL